MRLRGKLLLATISFCVPFLAFNMAFPFVYGQASFPRSLVRSVGAFQYPLFPNTYDRKNLDAWVAVIGDSYAQGMGDGYLGGEPKFTIFHHLKEELGKNYLIFARSGFGSINAVRELIVGVDLMNVSWLYPNLVPPDEIVLVFYEGNDLNNNILHLEGADQGSDGILPFVRSQILGPPSISARFDSKLPFARMPVNVLVKFVRNFGKGSGQAPPKPNHVSVAGQEFSVRGIQGSGMELSEDQIDLALQALEASLRVLQAWSPDSRVHIVYIPSVATAYDWQEPVEHQTYHSAGPLRTSLKENLQNSRMIRAKVRELAGAGGFDFIDTTDGIRARTKSELLHGPRDWKHLNGRGYAAVAEIVAEELQPSEFRR